jgi:ferredoxin
VRRLHGGVTACLDSAILAKVALPDVLDWRLSDEADLAKRERLRAQFVRRRSSTRSRRNAGEGRLFGLAIDPTKCKGCGECVEVCGSHPALRMVAKSPAILANAAVASRLVRELPRRRHASPRRRSAT